MIELSKTNKRNVRGKTLRSFFVSKCLNAKMFKYESVSYKNAKSIKARNKALYKGLAIILQLL